MKIKYVQLESQAFFADCDFNMMTAAERGAYCTLLLHLYCSGGKCEFEPAFLGKLCNCEEFESIWKVIAKKFQTRKGVIRHKRVTKELQRAKRFTQRQRESGLKGAERRWGGHSQPNGEPIAKKRKGNENEKESEEPTNTNASEQAPSFSSSVRPVAGLTESRRCCSASGPQGLPGRVEGAESISAIIERLAVSRASCPRTEGGTPSTPAGAADQTRGLYFHQALTDIIRPRTRSDRTCFRNVADWMVRRRAEGRFSDDTFARVLAFAEEAKTARNPAAAFMALLKKELRYPNG